MVLKKNILITGGNGFIGRHLQKYLDDRNYHVIAPGREALDIMSTAFLEQYFDMGISHVIHLAGKTYVPDSWEMTEYFFNVNIMGTLNVIEYCRKIKCSMTYVSAYVYGIPNVFPIPENAEIKPNNPYAESKYMAEELCKFYCRCFDMNISILRLFNVFGPGQSERFLIPFIIKQVLSERDRVEVQDLEPKRDYIYIEDVCRAIEMSLSNTIGCQIYNVGSGISYSVHDVIDMIQRAAGTNKKVFSQNVNRKNEILDAVADISAIGKMWNWKPMISIEEGIVKCLRGEN